MKLKITFKSIILIVISLIILSPIIFLFVVIVMPYIDSNKHICENKLSISKELPNVYPLTIVGSHKFQLSLDKLDNKYVGSDFEPWVGYQGKNCILEYKYGKLGNIAKIEEITDSGIVQVGTLSFSISITSDKTTSVGYDFSNISKTIKSSIIVKNEKQVYIDFPLKPSDNSIRLFYDDGLMFKNNIEVHRKIEFNKINGKWVVKVVPLE